MESGPSPLLNPFLYRTMSDAGLGYGGIEGGQKRGTRVAVCRATSILCSLAAGQQLIYHFTSPSLHPLAQGSHPS